jgi:CubicO group peptidase (beta-lactamase class C family)
MRSQAPKVRRLSARVTQFGRKQPSRLKALVENCLRLAEEFDYRLLMRLPLLCVLLISVVIHSTEAAATDVRRLDKSRITQAEIDAKVTSLMKAAEVPGVAIAILNDGKIAYLKTYGFRDTERKLPLTADSVMYAASFTKVSFAYMAMELVHSGVLNLDKPIYQYLPQPLPEYPDYRDLAGDQRYKRMTARMLLSHTSGFANLRWLEQDHKLKIHFEPGSRYAYSGEGMRLLQLVIETIAGKPLEMLMQDLVFRPFGMTRTSMIWQSNFDGDYANGYDEYGRSLGPEKRDKADAAGSMQTTISDFSRFMQAVARRERLRKQTWEQMFTPQISIASKRQFPTLANEPTDQNNSIRLSYGLGWGLYWTPYGKAFFKEGHADGWRNYTVCFEDSKSGLVIMTNSGNGEGIFKYLLEALLKNNYTPVEWEGFAPYDQLPTRAPLTKHKAVHVEATVLDRYVGRYGEPPKLVLTIRREGDHLSVQENDEPKQDLLPDSDISFFSTVADDVYRFEMDSNGHVLRMTLHTDGKDIPISRIGNQER